MSTSLRKHLARIGRRGGLKSRRILAPEMAREMVRIREARRAYRRFHTSCFWSYDPDHRIMVADIPWVIEGLRKNGNREAWELASRLCH
ncbi:MAG TPA: hypothetical protein VF720_00440 [Candidatus Eisenbacteria bacterium]